MSAPLPDPAVTSPAPASPSLANNRWLRTAGWVVLAAIAVPTAAMLLYADGHGGGGIANGRWLLLAGWVVSLA